MKTKPLVSVDCDTLIFQSASVCESRTVEVTHIPTGKKKEFSNRTEFKEIMKSKEKEITPDYVIKDVQVAEDAPHVFKLIKNRIEQIKDNFSDCEIVLGAGASNNFRDKLPYPTSYKGNRKNTIKPLLLKEAQNYTINVHKAQVAMGCEQDDYTAILAYNALRDGRKAYLLSPDGDSRQFDGLALGKYDSKPNDCVDIQFMHEVAYNDKGFQSYGFPWMVMQAAVGDITDGLNPCYICGKRYGEKGHYNAVKNFKTKEEHASYLVNLYKNWYPSEFEYKDCFGNLIKADWKFMLELYWKGTTMMRSHNEEPCIWKFFNQYGIDL